MQLSRAAWIAALAAATSAVWAATAPAAPRVDCGPRDRPGIVVLSNDEAALYRSPGGTELRGCDRDGVDYPLAGHLNGFYPGPPTMALSGRTAAFVTDGLEDGLVVQSQRLQREGGFFYRVFRPRERIGKLRVRRDGSMAWVSCPVIDEKPDETLNSPRPNCVRAGRRRNSVYLFTPGDRYPMTAKTRRIGSGRRLDPRSLRMSATTISWVRKGKRRRVVYRRSG